MKIGIIGTRGIPNNYGGFEQLAEYLSAGLAARGHDVFVYSPHPDRQRFLVNQSVETGEPTVNVITNWQRSVTAAK